jgi:FAD/FMN-containing dehydrogenase
MAIREFKSQSEAADPAWAGSANIENGTRIDLSKLNTIEVDPDSKVASVSVGQQWGTIYQQLGEQGLAIVGGWVSKVGLGGLILGGSSCIPLTID